MGSKFRPHVSMHSSGENHIYTPSGIKVTATQAGMDLLYGPGFKEKVIESATSSSKQANNKKGTNHD